MADGNGAQSLGNPMGIWSALLDFATRVGSTDLVNQTPSTFNMMSEQDREFLTNAMASYMKESDPVRQLKENLDVLMNLEFRAPNEEQKAQGIAALDHITDLCCSLDLATDFHKLGGFRVLVPLLASGATEFREHGAGLIGELAQNHPYCQEALHKSNVLGLLLQLMDADPEPAVRAKALFAVSCLIRNNEALEKEFVRLDGFNYLLRATMSDYERLSTKASFLLSVVLAKPENKDIALQIGLIKQFASMLSRHPQARAGEQTTAALITLIEDYPKAIEACKKPELGLKKILEDRLKEIGSNSENEEERYNIDQLLKTCWSSG